MGLEQIGDVDVERTAKLLGGRHTLHRQIRSRLEAHDLLEQGLPGEALLHLVNGVSILQTSPELNVEKVVGISLRTLQRRKKQPRSALSAEQSGRTWKFAEILARTSDFFGSQSEAERWLETPAIALDRRKPIDLLSTPAGVEMVEDHLGRLEYGVYT